LGKRDGAMWRRLVIQKALVPIVVFCATAAVPLGAAGQQAKPPKAARLADLLALPTEEYRVDPYIRAAQSLQAMGKDKACKLLGELAAKDQHPYTRTLVLCRMLFKAKPKSTFRRAAIGAPVFPAKTEDDDWPNEPIEIVDGTPFLVASGYILGGLPERPSDYLRYCVGKCDWNDFKYKPKSKAEKQKALKKFFSLPKLKGKLDKSEREDFEAQIK
jgi:hypothetical protein